MPLVYGSASVAVVVPAHNEERLIDVTLGQIPELVDAIYVVDDASSDGTWGKLAAVGDSRLRRIRHCSNRGVGAAIVSGYYQALREGNQIIAVMAGDAQMDPADLPALLHPIADGKASYVKGNRFRHQDYRNMPRLRRWAGKGLAWVTRTFTGLDVDDTQCGYTALAAECAATLPLDDLWPRYGYPNDLLGLLAWGGFEVVEVPVRPVYAGESSGIRPWHAALIMGLILRRWSEFRLSGARRF
jgi:glycosyltransferase involved in cell wall biosynthesis